MPVVLCYAVVAATSLLLAVAGKGGLGEIVGRLLSILLSLPWCAAADYLGAREGTAGGLFIAAVGMCINGALLWVFFARKGKKNVR